MSGPTRRLDIDPDQPQAAVIEMAAASLRAGELVAFATETVYGLGANASDDQAVSKIFAAKGRPQTNPLIVHVSSVEAARRHTAEWSQDAQRLAEAFWPGPLTLVVPKGDGIAGSVCAGLDTVAVRVPDVPVARALLEAAGVPIAAPSANRSEHVSPTTAQHVLDDLDGRVAMVLDSGPTGVGIESTVLDVTTATPRLLRRGPVGFEAIQGVLGRAIEVVEQHLEVASPQRSPGQAVRHYAPDVPTVRFERDTDAVVGAGDVVLVVGRPASQFPSDVPSHRLAEPQAAARQLYAALRELESMAPGRIVVLMPPPEPRWAAVRDRLLRATTPGE